MENAKQKSLNSEAGTSDTLRRFTAICAAMPGLVYQFKIDAAGGHSFTFISASAETILGVEPDEIYKDASVAFSLFHPDDSIALMNRAFFSAETLQQRSYVFRILDRNTGYYKWVRANSKAEKLEDGSVIWHGIMIDVTRDKENEEHRMAIADEVNRELESFSYTVSHDLQTPLRSIIGFSKILLLEHKEELNAEIKDCLEIIEANARRMSDLIKNLLSFSRLGKAAIHYSRIDMHAQVQQVITELLTGTDQKEIKINTHNLLPATGDANLVKQVWINMIGNAFKYSSKKDLPVIEIGMAEGQNELVYFIKDNGAGFDMQYVHKLFAPFQRIHSQEEFEGSGIGLATVHRIITKHGGRVWAEAKPGDGACFYFSLPVVKD